MQNKNIFLKTTYSTPSSRYYRSIRYKINQSGNTLNTTNHLTSVTHNTSHWKKPYSSSVCKPSATHNTNIKIILNPQRQILELKNSYIQTWDSLMHSHEKIKQIQDSKANQKICLPSIIDFEPSMFTSLDPINLPIEHIQKGIAQLKASLPGPKAQMAQIKTDLQKIRQRVLQDLQVTQKKGKEEFERLRKMMKMNQVQLQQQNMRSKRKLIELEEQDRFFTKDFEQTKPRLCKLQVEIFASKPFDLVREDKTQLECQDYF